MITSVQRKKIVKDFFDKANSKNLIVFKDRSKFSQKTIHVTNNTQQSALNYQRFKNIFEDPKQLKQFCDFNNNQFNISEKDSRRLITNYFLFHALNYIEAYKLFLLEILKPGIKIGKRKKIISLKMELGTMVVSLCQELKFNDFEKLFPRLFRNVLGHSSWWWAKNRLAYDDNGTVKYLTYKEFTDSMTEFSNNMTEIIDEYIRRKASSKIPNSKVNEKIV